MGTEQLEEATEALKVRAFFGLALPEEQRDSLDRYLAACAASAPQFRWTPAPNLHLTVRFVGNTEQFIVEGIADRLADRQPAGFELELGMVGTFKRGRLVRVVWLQVSSGGDAAADLAAAVESECTSVGLAPEARPFQPHLTLARARARDGATLPPLTKPPELPPWRANELILYRSHLGRGGSVYEPLRRIRLS
jgi:RNA 2',3'-cyclic 3'-phosphodiesterase